MKSKFIKRLFSIILVMVTIISSSSLLFACTVTEYFSNTRVVLVSKELDETTSQARNRINAIKNCFDAISTKTLLRLAYYYGPGISNRNNSTASMLNLVKNYSEYYDINQILSTITWLSWHKVQLTSKTIHILALSNYPIYDRNEMGTGLSKISDYIVYDGDSMRVSQNIEFMECISGASENRQRAGHGDTLPTLSSSDWVGNNVYLYQHQDAIESTEYNPSNKLAIFVISDSLESKESVAIFVNSLYSDSNCNVMFMDRRALSASEMPSEGTPFGFDNAKQWLVPLKYDFNSKYTNVLISPGVVDSGADCPLFLYEKAYDYYACESGLAPDSELERFGVKNTNLLTTYFIKYYLFGIDGEENNAFTLENAEHVYIGSNGKKDDAINDVIKDMSFADLYSKIFDSTQTIANGAELDFYENYDLFISTALYNVYTLSDLHGFENNLESIVRNKIIGIEDEPLIDEDYGPFHRAYDKYVTTFIVDSSTFDDITIPSYTKSYKPVVSKVYCNTSSQGNSTYAINNISDIYSSQNLTGSLNSIIIYGFTSSEKTKVDYDDAFENDSESKKEFERENNIEKDGFKASFVLDSINLRVELSSTEELRSSYAVVYRFYKKKSSSSISESVSLCYLTREGASNIYSLQMDIGAIVLSDEKVPLGGSSGLFGNTKQDPLGQVPHFGKESRAKDYIKSMSSSNKLNTYGSGLYYSGVSSYDKECFVELIFPDTEDSGELSIKIMSLKIY